MLIMRETVPNLWLGDPLYSTIYAASPTERPSALDPIASYPVHVAGSIDIKLNSMKYDYENHWVAISSQIIELNEGKTDTDTAHHHQAASSGSVRV